jgi:hypothetical protein
MYPRMPPTRKEASAALVEPHLQDTPIGPQFLMNLGIESTNWSSCRWGQHEHRLCKAARLSAP